MERVGTLIDKLKEQFDQKADAAKLLVNTRLLLAELQTALQQQPATIKNKVSVMMPSSYASAADNAGSVTEQTAAPVSIPTPVPHQEEEIVEIPEEEKQEELIPWMMNVPVEIPTMVHQPVSAKKEIFELNELLVAHHEHPEVNDRLKEERTEVATKLQSAPVRDLKKAVGINDRYLFVNELFRGDESMYERSMKTINGFTIYPEAQYWIERELKVKLSWNDQCEAARLFDQLVKRRFA